MKKIILISLLLFTVHSYGETIYVLDESMLTNHNYNPKYDYYPWAYKNSNVANNTTTSFSNDLKNKNQYLEKRINNNLDTLFQGSVSEMLSKSISINQDRYEMNLINNSSRSSGGCGSRGGPGWRKLNGQCASWDD